MKVAIFAGLLAVCGLSGLLPCPSSAETAQLVRTATGVRVTTASGVVTVEPWTAGDIHVHWDQSADARTVFSPAVIASPAAQDWTITPEDGGYTVVTKSLRVHIDPAAAEVSFSDSSGKIVGEDGHRRLSADAVVQAFHVNGASAYYGLGQHQGGLMDYAGNTIRLQQANSDVGVPMLVASRGFGLLWNNASVTTVDVGLPQEGQSVKFSSEAGGAVDYYFMYGPDIDQVIGEYRELTGQAPMMARWTWGLWQSKEHYETQEELLSVASRYRSLNIPLDAVVQDWQYWAKGDWGDHVMEPSRFPDPAGMVRQLHQQNVHTIVSVWPRFDLGTANLAELDAAGAAFPKVYNNVYPPGQGRWYDPYSAKGRDIYWKQIARTLGSYGFDGWWLDASEAELGGTWGDMRQVTTAAGPGTEVYNAYPLEHTTAVYTGARRDFPDKRPILLTRSAYAGQQRNAAITWSGDTHGRWDVFRRQIPAGLNFSISGIPYWSADIGGFFGGDPKTPEYAELFTRWFQFAVFNPMFRIHGTSQGKEIWAFDADTQKILIDYDHLRYRLLPYIYSASWDVSHNNGTMMRPLVMDFRDDQTALGLRDEFMFGKALLVAPVTEPGADTRNVYLPGRSDWFDFWTGERHKGGHSVAAKAPIATIPLYVRAGSILPLGPVVQYADAPSQEPVEIRVYPGADGHYQLYDDAGDGYGYQKGEYAVVDFDWSDAKARLDLSARKGTFPGMLSQRTYRIVCAVNNAVKEIRYTGQAVSVDLGGCR